MDAFDGHSVVDNPERRRFEVRRGRRVLGWAAYEQTAELLVFTHTEVPSELEGRGIGSALIRAGLAHARENGLKVTPICPFFAAYMKKHAETQELLAPAFRKALGLPPE